MSAKCEQANCGHYHTERGCGSCKLNPDSEIAILKTERDKLRNFIQVELDSMRHLVSEEEGGSLAEFANVMKGRIAKYRTILKEK